jgi:uncharacterized membrane protein
MSGRATYIHVGAIIGTMMVGNVFFVIMPAQCALVSAIEMGTQPDAEKPKNALLRSRHNNYLTLPVLFIMISNHFPSTYGNGWNWLILSALALISVAVRHYFNTRHQGQHFFWIMPMAVLSMMVMAYVTAPATQVHDTVDAKTVTDASVMAMINSHCSSCHAAYPTHPAFATAPAGVVLDHLAQVRLQASRILQQTVTTHVMPLGNSTGMTLHERQQLGAWIALQQEE